MGRRPNWRWVVCFAAVASAGAICRLAAVPSALVEVPTGQTSPAVEGDRPLPATARPLPGEQAGSPLDPQGSGPLRKTADPVSFGAEAVEQRLRGAVRYLASDELQGRGLGTAGIDLAAEHIAEAFIAAGLRTDLYRGKPFQEFSIAKRLVLGDSNRMEIGTHQGERLPLAVSRDYTPLSFSRAGAFDLPLAFVGYGITAPELGYDDYAGIEAAGKAVIVLRHEPRQEDAGGVFKGPSNTEHAYLPRKISNAVRHGAAGVVFCTDRGSLGERPAEERSTDHAEVQDDPLLKFPVRGYVGDRRVPVFHCQRSVIDPLIRSAAGKGLAQLESEIDGDLVPRSTDLGGWRIRGEVSLKYVGRAIKNVVAVLDGKGPLAEEAIVLGAHYDHLGMGGMGSLAPGTGAVHNGADDNASGTAVLTEVARSLAARPNRPSRSIVFVAFSAEESGLIGSEYYVRNPLVPLKKTVAMINFDMVGRLRQETLTIHGIESAAEFGPLVSSLGGRYGFRVRKSPAMFGPSDHLAFYMANVPVLHFFTGLHKDYHRPSDDYEKLDYDGMRRIAEMSAELVSQLATAKDRPRFASPFEGLVDFIEPIAPESARTRPRQAFLGVVRDPNYRGPGFAVRQITKSGPAEKSGLQAGDVVIQLGDTVIRESEDLTPCVRAMRPGQRAPLVIERHGTRFELEVTLEAK
ncbi:MAG: M20/M25/M40 family metallo-hydrolase [Pirellulales bacterium]|nr:M20/M25/M40 family metallo-hydrolase [Pirellulales bacterium]